MHTCIYVSHSTHLKVRKKPDHRAGAYVQFVEQSFSLQQKYQCISVTHTHTHTHTYSHISTHIHTHTHTKGISNTVQHITAQQITTHHNTSQHCTVYHITAQCITAQYNTLVVNSTSKQHLHGRKE
jgi:hypothetical protein